MITHELRKLLSYQPGFPSAVSIALVLCGILLIIGLWTPIAGILLGLLQFQNSLHSIDPWMSVRLGIFASALAMIGPGGWSVDARLFGWKRLEVPPRKINGPRTDLVE